MFDHDTREIRASFKDILGIPWAIAKWSPSYPLPPSPKRCRVYFQWAADVVVVVVDDVVDIDTAFSAAWLGGSVNFSGSSSSLFFFSNLLHHGIHPHMWRRGWTERRRKKTHFLLCNDEIIVIVMIWWYRIFINQHIFESSKNFHFDLEAFQMACIPTATYSGAFPAGKIRAKMSVLMVFINVIQRFCMFGH